MVRLPTFILSLFVLGSAYAADVHDAPMPESVNWIGIIAFLVIMVGMCVGFFWMIMRNDKKTKQQGKNSKA